MPLNRVPVRCRLPSMFRVTLWTVGLAVVRAKFAAECIVKLHWENGVVDPRIERWNVAFGAGALIVNGQNTVIGQFDPARFILIAQRDRAGAPGRWQALLA